MVNLNAELSDMKDNSRSLWVSAKYWWFTGTLRALFPLYHATSCSRLNLNQTSFNIFPTCISNRLFPFELFDLISFIDKLEETELCCSGQSQGFNSRIIRNPHLSFLFIAHTIWFSRSIGMLLIVPHWNVFLVFNAYLCHLE